MGSTQCRLRGGPLSGRCSASSPQPGVRVPHPGQGAGVAAGGGAADAVLPGPGPARLCAVEPADTGSLEPLALLGQLLLLRLDGLRLAGPLPDRLPGRRRRVRLGALLGGLLQPGGDGFDPSGRRAAWWSCDSSGGCGPARRGLDRLLGARRRVRRGLERGRLVPKSRPGAGRPSRPRRPPASGWSAPPRRGPSSAPGPGRPSARGEGSRRSAR